MSSTLKGIYTLIINLEKTQAVTIGKRGEVSFPAGHYAYVGSALNGIEARITRHLKKEKSLHWHIDYFLQRAQVEEIIYSTTERDIECIVASQLARKLTSIPHFGCSDCRCISHLYCCKDKRSLRNIVRDCFKKSGLTPVPHQPDWQF